MDRVLTILVSACAGVFLSVIAMMAMDTTAAANRSLTKELQDSKVRSEAAAQSSAAEIQSLRSVIKESSRESAELRATIEKMVADNEAAALRNTSLPVPKQVASTGNQIGEAVIRVAYVGVRAIDITDLSDSATQSSDPRMKIVVAIKNVSTTKKINYTTWGARQFGGSNEASLTDDAGNHYKRLYFGFGTKIVGREESASIYPGKEIHDVLVFEEPVDKSRTLTLTLPGAALGHSGSDVSIVLNPEQIEWLR